MSYITCFCNHCGREAGPANVQQQLLPLVPPTPSLAIWIILVDIGEVLWAAGTAAAPGHADAPSQKEGLGQLDGRGPMNVRWERRHKPVQSIK